MVKAEALAKRMLGLLEKKGCPAPSIALAIDLAARCRRHGRSGRGCFEQSRLGLEEQHRRDSSLEKPTAPETAISEAGEIEGAFASRQKRRSHNSRRGVNGEREFSDR